MRILGVFLILVGIALGLYVGLWWAFIGGVVQVIQAIRAEELDALRIGCGVAKMLFASFFGYVSLMLVAIPGCIMVKTGGGK